MNLEILLKQQWFKTEGRRTPANRIHGQTILLLWRWSWPNDLDMRTCSEDSEDVPAYHKMNCLSLNKQTARCDRMHYQAAFAGA